MADCNKRDAWAVGTSTLISTEEAHFHRGCSFLRRRLISTEEADFYRGGWFLRRRLISTAEAYFHWGGQFLRNRPIFVWKTRTMAQRKQGFHQERVCFTVCCSGTSGPPYYRGCRDVGTGWNFRGHRRYGDQSKFTAHPLSLPANREPFASIAVALGSKLKAKIWATNSSSLCPFSHLSLIRIDILSV